jgi:hypothetical protein
MLARRYGTPAVGVAIRRPAAPGRLVDGERLRSPVLLRLQRAVGNTAVAALVQRHPVDVELEVASPGERERLRQQGVTLPGVSPQSADPRSHRDYVDRTVRAVGYGIYVGGYLLYVDGLDLPVLVPESYFDDPAVTGPDRRQDPR